MSKLLLLCVFVFLFVTVFAHESSEHNRDVQEDIDDLKGMIDDLGRAEESSNPVGWITGVVTSIQGWFTDRFGNPFASNKPTVEEAAVPA